MMKLFFGYLKEHTALIFMYAGFLVLFPLIFFLYNVRTDAIEYAFLLSLVWVTGCGAAGFLRYKRRHEELLEIERRASAELYGLPVAASLLEKDYQRILEKVYRDKEELESAGREFRREMADYYGMWVHQIKTPIAAMKVLLQAYALEEDQCEAKEYEERLHTLIREIKPELFKIEQYVEMVLTYLRTTDMTADFVFGKCALDDMIRHGVKKYSQMFILQKIKLNYEPSGMTVVTDEKWLVFVIEQLLSNALKYTNDGSISIYVQKVPCNEGLCEREDPDAALVSDSELVSGAALASDTDREEDCLVIEDTGIGIWADDLPRVFEKGFTGYNGRENKKSTGIGLYLCKTIMDKLGHRLWLESEVGKGTKAYIGLGRRNEGGFLTNL